MLFSGGCSSKCVIITALLFDWEKIFTRKTIHNQQTPPSTGERLNVKGVPYDDIKRAERWLLFGLHLKRKLPIRAALYGVMCFPVAIFLHKILQNLPSPKKQQLTASNICRLIARCQQCKIVPLRIVNWAGCPSRFWPSFGGGRLHHPPTPACDVMLGENYAIARQLLLCFITVPQDCVRLSAVPQSIIMLSAVVCVCVCLWQLIYKKIKQRLLE